MSESSAVVFVAKTSNDHSTLNDTLEDVLMSLDLMTCCNNVSVQYVQLSCVRFEYVVFYMNVKTKTELVFVLCLKSKILLRFCGNNSKDPMMFCCPWI